MQQPQLVIYGGLFVAILFINHYFAREDCDGGKSIGYSLIPSALITLCVFALNKWVLSASFVQNMSTGGGGVKMSFPTSVPF